MAVATLTACRVSGCAKSVLPALGSERLCLQHFLENTLTRARQALEHCQQDQPLDPSTLDWLFEDAQYTVQWLLRNTTAEEPDQREKVLEVMLCISNIYDYLSHHSVQLKHAE